jgi:hypothetical protein
MLSPWNPVSVRRLRRSIEEFAPDVAHVHNTLYAMSPAVKQRGALLEIWQRAKDAHGTSRRST